MGYLIFIPWGLIVVFGSISLLDQFVLNPKLYTDPIGYPTTVFYITNIILFYLAISIKLLKSKLH